MAVTLLQFFFVSASVISCLEFVVFLCICYLSFLLCLGRSVLRDCGIPWVSSLKFCICESGSAHLKCVCVCVCMCVCVCVCVCVCGLVLQYSGMDKNFISADTISFCVFHLFC